MVELIPHAVVASLVNKLASAAFCEFGRIYGVVDEMVKLKTTVESIKVVLLDAQEKQEREHAVQLWITRLKDVLYLAEDVLDEFAIEDTRQRHKVDSSRKNKLTKVFHSLSPNRLVFRHQMARKIEKVREGFNYVVQEMSRLNLRPNIVVIEQTDGVKRETVSFVLESDIIEREDSKKKIINLLKQLNESQNISLVAIVGIGGLGKTALAQMIYNDVEVKNIFEKQMWVCISDNFDVKTIVRNMLESLTKDKIDDKLSLDNLQNKLREALRDKKYLLVLDDTWNESLEKWTQLKTYLMCGAEDSKVLVTTRSEIVAQTMGVNDPYVLNGLTSEESWRVLKKITFGDDTIGVNKNLEATGKKIAEKCKGVPLAIRTLGGLLQSKSEKNEWDDILQGDFWKLCEDEDSIMPVLKLSYQKLSPPMRQCFAYCAMYPKDWVLEKDELIQLWMAQGYLECSDEKKLPEDVGNQFVKIFLMKSFFQDAEMNDFGDIYHFKMHDLAMQVAGNDCCCLDGAAKRVVGRPMHVWLGDDYAKEAGWLELLEKSRLRTLIVDTSSLSEKELSIVLNFKHLRALSLKSDRSHYLDSIGKLKHLRYLNLLKFQLRHRSLHVFPVNLRHLLINGTDDMQHNGGLIYSNWLSSLTNIVEISLISCKGVHNIPPLECLPFLKSLSIEYLPELECIYFEEGGTFFPSLERLWIVDCGKFRGWCRLGDDLNDTSCSSHEHYLSFPRLSDLRIEGCRELTHVPSFPLSMLNFLRIDRMFSEMIKLPKDWMKILTSPVSRTFMVFKASIGGNWNLL